MSKHLKMLLGGSPCTHWSIAQKNNRETEASGIGWELFKNFLYARDKFKPDYFLYENNKSAAQPIKDQISKELGVDLQYINSALVSAQNRQRFYGHNIPGVPQPQDRGILLRDVLDNAIAFQEKSYCLDANYYKGSSLEHTLQKSVRTMVAESVCVAQRGRYSDSGNRTVKGNGKINQYYEAREDGKTNTLTTVQKDNLIAEPIRIGTIESGERSAKSDSQANRVYSYLGKSVTLNANGGGGGAKTGLYACPVDDLTPFVQKKIKSIVNKYGYLPEKFNPYNAAEIVDKAPTLTAQCASQTKSSTVMVVERWGGKTYPIYQVQNGLITIKDKQYPIKLPDGYYIIRKLTVNECRRLQTIPDWYKMPCSASQNYKMLGNGWTIEVIKHILSYIPGIKDCTVEVLSMYDGMSCGQIALTELGCKIERYVSYEIDKYCIQTTQMNFPKTEQRGDAFQLRNTNWNY